MPSSRTNDQRTHPSQSTLIIGTFGIRRTFLVRTNTVNATMSSSPIMNQCIIIQLPK